MLGRTTTQDSNFRSESPAEKLGFTYIRKFKVYPDHVSWKDFLIQGEDREVRSDQGT